MVGAPALTALFVTARLRSSRLPRKMLLDVGGRPALGHVLERMRRPVLPELHVLCTTKRDAALAELAEEAGWLVERGDERDVLRRYLDAADRFGVGFFVNVDGDDLFCDDASVDRIIECHHATRADYIHCEGMPFGAAPLGVRVDALRDVCAWKAETDTQGWGKYFTGSGRYRVEALRAPALLRRPEYRMTLDYPEDLEFFREVCARLPGESPPLVDVVALLDADPVLAARGARMSDEYWRRFQAEHGDFQPTGVNP